MQDILDDLQALKSNMDAAIADMSARVTAAQTTEDPVWVSIKTTLTANGWTAPKDDGDISEALS